MTKERKLNLGDPDQIQRRIDEKRRAKGIVVTKSKYLPGFGVKLVDYELIEGEMMRTINGVTTPYYERL